MKRPTVYLMGGVFLFGFLVFLLWSFGGVSGHLLGDRESQVRAVYEAWESQPFVDVNNREALAPAINAIEIAGRSHLTSQQETTLRNSLTAFILGLSGGGFEDYVEFRYPTELNLDRNLAIDRLSKPLPPNLFPRLFTDSPMPVLEHSIFPVEKSHAQAKTDFELAADVMNLSGGGAMENAFVEGLCIELSEVIVRKVNKLQATLSKWLSETVPSAGLVGMVGRDLSRSHTNTMILTLPPKRSFAQYVESRPETLTAEVILMINYVAPDHAGPVGIAFYWHEGEQCWIPYHFIQVGLHRETGMAVPF